MQPAPRMLVGGVISSPHCAQSEQAWSEEEAEPVRNEQKSASAFYRGGAARARRCANGAEEGQRPRDSDRDRDRDRETDTECVANWCDCCIFLLVIYLRYLTHIAASLLIVEVRCE